MHSDHAEVLRLASLKRIKPVHYVSTTSVFDCAHHKLLHTVFENDQLVPSAGSPQVSLAGGYPQSKWVAERLCMLARKKGNVIRLPLRTPT